MGIIRGLCADVAELVDALDLGSSAARCESSSLSVRTILINSTVHKSLLSRENSTILLYLKTINAQYSLASSLN